MRLLFFNYFKLLFIEIQDLWHKKYSIKNLSTKKIQILFLILFLEVKVFLQFSHFFSAVFLKNNRSYLPDLVFLVAFK